jgi:hypothetical protein
MMTNEIESVRETLANEKEERIKAELDAQEVWTSFESEYTQPMNNFDMNTGEI